MEFLYKLFIKDYKNTKNPEVIKKYGLLAGIIGILLNIILFIVKIILAIISKSVSIISDAINNLSDASSSIITIIGFKLSSKPADKEHPYGHGRGEYISAFIISFIIIFIGIELGISSVNKIINPTVIKFSNVMIAILFITVLIKLWMAIFYSKTSKKINSLTLKASSKDSVNDVITTLIILIGLFVGKAFNINLDGYLGLGVCIYILITGIQLIKETINKLLGGNVDTELVDKIKQDILNNQNILGLHDVLCHSYGFNKIYMSLDVEIDSSTSLIDAHTLVDDIEIFIKKKYNVDLVIHVDPILLNDELYNQVNKELKEIINSINENLTFHDLKIITEKNKIHISFDLQVPYDFEMQNKEIYTLINKELKNINKDYKISITFDKI